MIILTDHTTPRLSYISRYLLENVLGAELRSSEEALEGECVVAYTISKPSIPCIHVYPYGLLDEEDTRPQQLIMDLWEGLPVFFPVEGDIPFDIFSAAFYLVSRYEEYLPHEKDEYGRYSHKNSLAWREDFLKLPLVDLWMMKFRELVRWNFPREQLVYRTFSFVPSYDIDHAWCYLRKGLVRTAGQFTRDLLSGDFSTAGRRMRVLRGKEKDPYDIYEWLDALHLKYRLKPYYFFPLAQKVQGYDKNISPYDRKLRELMAYHAEGYRTGVHPSWRSSDSEKLLREEFAIFSSITGYDPRYSRFHYIRFSLPEGYRRLLQNGIAEDHSMGYGSINGFRASTSIAFPWYDLEKEEQTSLMVQPYCWMDANSYYEQGYTPAQTFDELKEFHEVLKKAKGTMVTISHNNFLSTEHGFGGWKEVYEIFLDQVVYWDT